MAERVHGRLGHHLARGARSATRGPAVRRRAVYRLRHERAGPSHASNDGSGRTRQELQAHVEWGNSQ